MEIHLIKQADKIVGLAQGDTATWFQRNEFPVGCLVEIVEDIDCHAVEGII